MSRSSIRATAALLGLATMAFADRRPVTIDDVVNAAPANRGTIVWSPDSERFAIVEHGEIIIHEIRTGKERPLIPMDKLEKAAVPVPAARAFDWTNRRVSEHAVQWFADNKRLLVSASGDLFILDVAKGRFEPLTQTAETEHDPKLSPDNRYVSYERANDLYVVEVDSKVVTRLTSSGSETLLNGRSDWVYPEELDLDTAYWWSPDSRSIAYLQFDIAREPLYPQVDLLKSHVLTEPERYPKAGDPNADVRLGVVAASGGDTKWMELGDPRDALLARVTWSPDSRVLLTARLNRIQNRLDLMTADATGAARTIVHEEDPYWINVKGGPQFVGDGNQFLWTSERSGFRHLYLYDLSGKLERQLTSGEWQIDDVSGVDLQHRTVFFTSTEQSPLEHQLYRIGLDGTRKQRLTKSAGTHTISMSPNAAYYMDDFSSLTTPPTRTLCRSDGSIVREFRGADKNVNDLDVLPSEIVPVKASDGTLLYGRVIKPAAFSEGRKYPAVVMVYGGPGAQSVRNAWSGISWEQVLAHRGFVVWALDNRGSTGRGHKFESVIYHDLGDHELSDQREGIQYLTGRGFVDPERIGMYGWSYGGFMTLYTATHAPGLLKAAIAGAPVTDWRNYDSIYTERYMGLPESDADAYRKTSPQRSAAALERTKLLMIHNIEDDNVHFQNTMQMADAFEKANKKFYMQVYPQKTHGVSGSLQRPLLEEETAFFEENLK